MQHRAQIAIFYVYIQMNFSLKFPYRTNVKDLLQAAANTRANSDDDVGG